MRASRVADEESQAQEQPLSGLSRRTDTAGATQTDPEQATTLRTENQRTNGADSRDSLDRQDRHDYHVTMDRTIANTAKTNLHVDPELWHALRFRAFEERITATEALNRAIAEYVAKPAPKSKPTKKGA